MSAAKDIAPESIRPKHLQRDAAQLLKWELANESRRGRGLLGLSQADLGRRIGIQQWQVARCEDQHDRNYQFSFKHVHLGPPEWGLPLIRVLLAHKRAQLVEAPDVDFDNAMDLLTGVQCDLNELSTATMKAAASGMEGRGELALMRDAAVKNATRSLQVERFAQVRLMRERREGE